MKRRGFLGKVAGGAVAGATGITQAQEKAAPAVAETAPLVKTPAVIMAPRADGVEVIWAISKLARGHVEWKGEDGSSGMAGADRFGFVPQGDEILRVKITGLKPGSSYQLRSITDSSDGKDRIEGPWKKFRTLDPAAEETRFVIWNDTHQNDETIKRLHEITPGGDFLLWNGDTCNDWHQEDSLIPTLLHPAGQDVSENRPMLLVWGNHDVRGKWAYRVPELIATPDGRPFYAFRSGPVAVICLHTGEDKPDNHPSFGGRVAFEALRREQAEWLKQVTTLPGFRDAPYRVVFCHIPLRWTKEVPDAGYEKGGYDAFSRFSREAWHDALVAWKTQIIVSGHTHSPAWIESSLEFPYAQLVGGGPQPQRATWIEGKADATALAFVMKDLAGNVIREVSLKPLA